MNGMIMVIIVVLLVVSFQEYKKDAYKHEEQMILIQRDTMPFDSIVVIQGKRYKLVKNE